MAELIAILRNMADWQIMLRWSMGTFGLAIISFISHLRTPENKRSKGMQPFSFMFLVGAVSLIISILLFFLDK